MHPERSREHGPVVERRLPLGRAPRGPRRAQRTSCCPRSSRLARLARGEGGGVRRRGQVRPDASDGRGAGHARAGVRRLRGPGPAGKRPHQGDARAGRADPARGHGDRHRAQHASRVRRAGARSVSRPRPACAIIAAGRSVRGARRARRARRGLRRAEDGRGLADEDRERPPAHGLRPARRPRRDLPAGAAEGQLDHARQGEPGHARGRHPGRGPGDRQRRRRSRSAGCRATSSSTSSSR